MYLLAVQSCDASYRPPSRIYLDRATLLKVIQQIKDKDFLRACDIEVLFVICKVLI
jgi:hypothetical protein